MRSVFGRYGLSALIVAMASASLFGVRCASTQAGGSGGTSPQSDSKAVDYDPDRAFLTLAQIEPVPSAPPADAPLPELGPSETRRVARARQLYAQQRFTEAALELEKALRRQPDHPLLHRESALIHRAAGNNERVRAHLRKAMERYGDDIVTNYLAGRLAMDDHKPAEAMRSFCVALKSSNASEMPAFAASCHFYLAKVLRGEGYLTASIEESRRYEEATRPFIGKDDVEPELASLLRLNGGRAGEAIAEVYERLGKYSEAADALTASLANREVDAATHERLARLLIRAERFAEAQVQARAILGVSPEAVGLLTQIYERTGRPERVIEDLATLRERDKDDGDLLVAYVDALERFDRLAEAERALRAFLESHPDQQALYWRLMDVLIRRGDRSGAIRVAASAVRADAGLYDIARDKVLSLVTGPDGAASLIHEFDASSERDPATNCLLGELALRSHKDELAERLFKRASEADSQLVPAKVGLGELLARRCAWNEIIELVTTPAETFESDYRLQRLAGRTYAALDDYAHAETHLTNAIRLNRSDSESMYILAEMLVESGERDRAIREYESLLAVNPLHEEARESLVEMYLATDRRDDAVEQLAELKRRGAWARRIVRCEALLEVTADPQRDWDAYLRALQDDLDTHGPDSVTLEHAGRALLRDLRFEEALAAFQQAVQADPSNVEALDGMAESYRGLLQYDHAIETLQGMLACHPNRARWVGDLRRVLQYDLQFKKAADLALAQLDRPGLSENQTWEYRAMAVDSMLVGELYDRAIDTVRGWLGPSGTDARLTGWEIELLTRAERYDEAVAAARAWYERDRTDKEVRQRLFQTLISAKQYEDAQRLVLEFMEVDPTDLALQLMLVDALVAGDRGDDALELVNSLEYRVGPDQTRIWKLRIYQQGRRFDDAISLLTDWLREVASTPQSNISIAGLRGLLIGVLLNAGRHDEASAKLIQWIEDSRDLEERFQHLRRLATCYQLRDDAVRAIETLQDAYDLAATAQAAATTVRQRAVWEGAMTGLRNDLGYSLCDEGLRIDDAARMIRKALYRQPLNGAFLDSWGWVQYKKGDFESSIHWLEKAILMPGGKDPVASNHLGDAYWRAHRPGDAVHQWNESLTLIAEMLDEVDRGDLRNLRTEVQAKIDAHANGAEPAIAPTASKKSSSPGSGD